MDYTYQATLIPDPDGGFVVTFPDVPEAITAGLDSREALSNAAEALGLALRGYIADGKALPDAGQHENGIPVQAEAWSALKLAVIEAFNTANITKTELANRLGKKEPEARRILDPGHPTKLQTLEQTLTVLGKRLFVTVKDAA